MIWSLFVLPLVGLLIWRWKVAGPGIAIGETVLWSLLVPSWLILPIAGIPFDVTSTIACVGLILYCFHPDAAFRTTLCATDGAVLAMFGVHVLSDTLHEGFHIGIPCRAYGEWIVPYLAGRVSVHNVEDIRRLRPTACAVAIALGTWAAIEATSGINPVNSLIGQRPEDDMPQYVVRWGLKRAEGPTIHPIWFGMVQVLLLPWTLSAANSSFGGRAPRWQILAPICNVIGVCFSLSRGPWGMLAMTLYGAIACRIPKVRKVMLILAAIALVGAAFLSEAVIRGLHVLTSKPVSEVANLVVDGERVVLNETTHRVVLFEIYKEAMRRAGLIGFGTDRTTGFPVRVPLGELDPSATSRVPSVDNAYILMQLRFGLLGVISLILILGSAAVLSIVRGCRRNEQLALFHAAMGSMFAAIMIVLFAEYIPRDYGFLLFWSLGAVSGFDAYLNVQRSPTRSKMLRSGFRHRK